MDTTQVTLLSMETMGKSRISEIAQTRCDSARSLEPASRRMAHGGYRKTPAIRWHCRRGILAVWGYPSCWRGRDYVHRTAVVRIRMPGGVGERRRETSLYLD